MSNHMITTGMHLHVQPDLLLGKRVQITVSDGKPRFGIVVAFNWNPSPNVGAGSSVLVAPEDGPLQELYITEIQLAPAENYPANIPHDAVSVTGPKGKVWVWRTVSEFVISDAKGTQLDYRDNLTDALTRAYGLCTLVGLGWGNA